ncbi:IPT/TIG domain-containing protein [Paractinoplanes rhizophilus]|uniref:IPT/TIG domain-containing protein n=1 Tax=Paractinoplanes rhizophilus TaxID=1416877 RepID=A0ABW2I2W6_9ACTN
MSKSNPSTSRCSVRAGLASGAALSVVVAAAMSAPAYAAGISVATNPPAGPEGEATSITVSAASEWLNGVTSPFVTFSIPTCQTTYNATAQTEKVGADITTTVGNVLSTNTRKVTNNMLAVTVPAAVVTEAANNALQKWNVCVYQSSDTGAAQIGFGSYSVGVKATLDSVTPNSGPSGGGSTITVTGGGFPTTVGTTGIKSVTIDGVPLTGIKSLGNGAFSAVTPPHSAARDLTLAVTTPTGTVYMQNAYTYQFGVAAAPNTTPNESKFVDLDVTGSGFLNFDFNGAPGDAGAHIYLSQGPYDPAPDAVTPTNKANPGVAECSDVLVISDNEVICRLHMLALDPTNTEFQLRAARTITTGNATTVAPDLLTSNDPAITFSAEDLGMPVTQAGNPEVAANSTIIKVISPTQVQLSEDLVDDAVTTADVVVGAPRAAIAATAGNGDTTLTAVTAGTITANDIGRPLTPAGNIQKGTVVTSVSAPNAGVVTVGISRPTGGTVAAVEVNERVQVPDGAYTLTVVNNGTLDAQDTDAQYNNSIISSAATFTVADY